MTAGALFGLASVAGKAGLEQAGFPASVFSLLSGPGSLLAGLLPLLHPLLALAAALGAAGFLLFQKALSAGRISAVGPLVGGVSVALPSAIGILLLGEGAGALKVAGILLVLAGTGLLKQA